MSYCRWSDKSDVYVFECVLDDYIYVSFPDEIRLNDKKFKKRSHTIIYLFYLIKKGYKVPYHAIQCLLFAIIKKGDTVKESFIKKIINKLFKFFWR